MLRLEDLSRHLYPQSIGKTSGGDRIRISESSDGRKSSIARNGIHTNLYWEMGDDDWENLDFVPLAPTSAVTEGGIQDVLILLCQLAEKKIWLQLMWHANLQCTVLEVKQIDGLGMTVDVLVVNGYMKEGERAVFCTLDGTVVTEIRGLLTPPPSREMCVKADYIHHKEVKGAFGVKLIGNGLERVMAGTPTLVINEEDEEEDIKVEVMSDLTNLQGKLSVDKKGVMVQASTLGVWRRSSNFCGRRPNLLSPLVR
jgi:translation initiation factor 5B